MTKTTNYEISKKLAEIGFKKQAEFFFYLDKPDYGAWHISEEGQILANEKDDCLPSYDLETLIDALPEKTEIIISQLTDKRVFYLDYGLRGSEISVEIKENESLVDTAGRMIILLHEKNLIKF